MTNAWFPPAVTRDAARGPHDDGVLARELRLDGGDQLGQSLYRAIPMIGQRATNDRTDSMTSDGGPYDTMPWPSEIVPGVSAVHRPTMGMTGGLHGGQPLRLLKGHQGRVSVAGP